MTESAAESSKSTMTMESMTPTERSFASTSTTLSRSTQTNEQQLKCCESCFIGEDMVKQLCVKIELICSENSITSAIADTRYIFIYACVDIENNILCKYSCKFLIVRLIEICK